MPAYRIPVCGAVLARKVREVPSAGLPAEIPEVALLRDLHDGARGGLAHDLCLGSRARVLCGVELNGSSSVQHLAVLAVV